MNAAAKTARKYRQGISGVMFASVMSVALAQSGTPGAVSALGRLEPEDGVICINAPSTSPAISGLIMQSMVAGSSMARELMLESQLADYYQNIHVRGVGMLQFDKVRKSVETGYKESLGPLREWAGL